MSDSRTWIRYTTSNPKIDVQFKKENVVAISKTYNKKGSVSSYCIWLDGFSSPLSVFSDDADIREVEEFYKELCSE